MKKYLLLCSILICSCFLQAQWKITTEEFAKYKINYKMFTFAILSPKGDFAIGYELSDFEHKAKGLFYSLRVFYFKKNKTVEVKTAYLPIRFLVGIALAGNNKAVVVGNNGTLILTVDLKTMKVEKVFQHKKGVPGYKVESLVVQWAGRVYLNGYFYDETQKFVSDHIVELLLPNNKRPTVEFKKVIDYGAIIDKYEQQPGVLQVISGRVLYFVIAKPKKIKDPTGKERLINSQQLICYKDGKFTVIAEGGIGNFAGTETKIYGSYLKNLGTKSMAWETNIKTINGSQKWNLGEKNVSYTYPFISENAQTVIFCTLNLRSQSINIYYAREKDKYQTKVLYEDFPMGPMKISGTGNAYLVTTPKYIEVDTFDNLEKRKAALFNDNLD